MRLRASGSRLRSSQTLFSRDRRRIVDLVPCTGVREHRGYGYGSRRRCVCNSAEGSELESFWFTGKALEASCMW